MAQLIVRNLEDDVRDRLREQAQRHGRSMEEEVREIIRGAVTPANEPTLGLGTQIREVFAPYADDGPIPTLPRDAPRAAEFGEPGA